MKICIKARVRYRGKTTPSPHLIFILKKRWWIEVISAQQALCVKTPNKLILERPHNFMQVVLCKSVYLSFQRNTGMS